MGRPARTPADRRPLSWEPWARPPPRATPPCAASVWTATPAFGARPEPRSRAWGRVRSPPAAPTPPGSRQRTPDSPPRGGRQQRSPRQRSRRSRWTGKTSSDRLVDGLGGQRACAPWQKEALTELHEPGLLLPDDDLVLLVRGQRCEGRAGRGDELGSLDGAISHRLQYPRGPTCFFIFFWLCTSQIRPPVPTDTERLLNTTQNQGGHHGHGKHSALHFRAHRLLLTHPRRTS